MGLRSKDKLKKKPWMNTFNSPKAAVESKDGKLPISF
jgi:hypothetical protein